MTRRYIAPKRDISPAPDFTPDQLTRARQAKPDYPWAQYHIAKERLVRGLYRNEEEKMADNAIVATGNQLVAQANQFAMSKHEMQAMLMQAWKPSGNFSDQHVMQFAAIAHAIGANPAPAAGQVYGFIQNNRLMVVPSYTYYLQQAQRQFPLYITTRTMTPDEMAQYGVNPQTQVGAICELWRIDILKLAAAAGSKYSPVIGWAVVAKDKRPVEGRTIFWTAEKNAMKDACRKAGVDITGQLPAVEGFGYDAETDAWVSVSEQPQIAAPTPSAEDDNLLEGVVAEAEARKSAAINMGAETLDDKREVVEPVTALSWLKIRARVYHEAKVAQEAGLSDKPTGTLPSGFGDFMIANFNKEGAKRVIQKIAYAESSKELSPAMATGMLKVFQDHDCIKWMQDEIFSLDSFGDDEEAFEASILEATLSKEGVQDAA